MYLAGSDKQFRFICFDLDAKGGRPDLDAGRASLWLYDLGIPHLVAESGPSGGRHVWIALSEGVSAETVRAIGKLAQSQLPTLDLSPISNAVTGAVRPPGAPHRAGGRSRILEGHPDLLRWPTVDAGDIDRLLRYLVELTGGYREPQAPIRPDSVHTDSSGLPYLHRGTRPRTPTTPRFADVDRPGGDASALLASAMTRCVHAGMTFADMLAIAPNNPAFVHAYSERTGPLTREPRTPARSAAILRRQWEKAVAFIASAPEAFSGDDPTFDSRAAAVVEAVEALQQRADASPGRWARSRGAGAQSNTSGRYTDRLVLDALCVIALQSVKTSVDASARVLSAISGVGRETARTALLRLQDDGWIEADQVSEGNKAASWRLRNPSTGAEGLNWSHVSPPPAPPAAAALRNVLIQELTRRLTATTHDVFAAPHSLGRTAGRIYAQLQSATLTSVVELTLATGTTAATVRRHLRLLASTALAARLEHDWHRPEQDLRTAVARSLLVDGYLEQRERRYSAERQAFAWWRSELEARRSPRGARRRRNRHSSQRPLLAIAGAAIDYPIHPRRPDGRADFSAALKAILAGVFDAEPIEEASAAA